MRICLHYFRSFLIPTADIVHIAHVLPLGSKNVYHILFLAFAHQTCSYKWRIAHDVVIVNLVGLYFLWLWAGKDM